MFSRDLESGQRNRFIADGRNLHNTSRVSNLRCKCLPTYFSLSWSFYILTLIFLVSLVLGGFTNDSRILLFIVMSGWLISLALHEFGHAIVAYYGGDSSVVDKGYLNLDILRYSDPLMTFVLPALALIWGVALPGGAVMIMTSNLHNRKWMTLTSLAGPFSNFIFACIIAMLTYLSLLLIPIHIIDSTILAPALSLLVYLQIMATTLNLIVLPPLDGWGAVAPWLPDNFFLKRWMDNPWHSKSICLITFLIIFLGVQYIPGVLWLMRAMSQIFQLRPDLLTRGHSAMRSIFSGRF